MPNAAWLINPLSLVPLDFTLILSYGDWCHCPYFADEKFKEVSSLTLLSLGGKESDPMLTGEFSVANGYASCLGRVVLEDAE